MKHVLLSLLRPAMISLTLAWALLCATTVAAQEPFPLEPVDTSSPCSTLDSFRQSGR
ncbi:MAG: hypothetical protein RIC55_06930 [Pirellulaceae bacterium]